MKTNIKRDIIKLKKEKNAVILAHYYQPQEVQKIADYVGDSYYLSKIGLDCEENNIVFCGVKFMAESAKILAPNKRVFIPNKEAVCSMVNFAAKEEVLREKEKHPNAKVVSYINSLTELKTISEACCTSSSAVDIIKNIDADEILFVPDKNLGSYVNEQITDKKIILWNGHCYVHNQIKAQDIINMKEKHGQDIKVAVHPECTKEVRDLADFIGSTGQIIEYVTCDNSEKFLIVTEQGINYELKKRNPNKKFYYLDMVCKSMKKTSLQDIYYCLKNETNEIIIDDEIRELAYNALHNMHILSEKFKNASVN